MTPNRFSLRAAPVPLVSQVISIISERASSEGAGRWMPLSGGGCSLIHGQCLEGGIHQTTHPTHISLHPMIALGVRICREEGLVPHPSPPQLVLLSSRQKRVHRKAEAELWVTNELKGQKLNRTDRIK